MLGRVHRALNECTYVPTFKISHFHDTPYILEHLQDVAKDKKYQCKNMDVKRTVDEVCEQTRRYIIPLRTDSLIHGDPKSSNFLLTGSEANAVIDLDTCMHANPLIDIGDGFSSWCGRETDCFDPTNIPRLLNAYGQEGHEQFKLSEVCDAIACIILELTARFLTDAFEEVYFRFDPERYASLGEQNLARAMQCLDNYRTFVKW
jgi:Ser/Thr protein kinase RdoA (MazF antagonist)